MLVLPSFLLPTSGNQSYEKIPKLPSTTNNFEWIMYLKPYLLSLSTYIFLKKFFCTF